MQSIWQNAEIGDPLYQGLTLGGFHVGTPFLKASYPGLRAIRVGGVVTFVESLPDSYPITVAPSYVRGTPVRYTSTATFIKANHPGAASFLIEVQAAGGGSPTITGTTSAGDVIVTSGGSGGGFVACIVPASDLDTTEAITVGLGGANSSGQDSVFDTISGEVRAKGGLVGQSSGVISPALGAVASPVDHGGSGTTAGTALLNIPGGSSSAGFALQANRVYGGAGGHSHWGLGGTAGITSGAGGATSLTDGGAYGGGGAGVGRGQSQSGTATGASGADGVILVTALYDSAVSAVELLY